MSAAGLFTIGALVTVIVAAAMALLVYAAILDGRDQAAVDENLERTHSVRTSSTNLVETVRGAGGLTTLGAVIDRAGLAGVLATQGPYTIFAPSDEAFGHLPKGTVESLLSTPSTLAAVVSYHVVQGKLTATDVVRRISAETVQGEDLAITNNGSIRVDGAHVVQQDIEASNGVIHVIDRVLLPARI